MTLRRQDLWAIAGGAAWGLCWLPIGAAPLLPLTFVLALRGVRLWRTPRDAVRFGLVFAGMRFVVCAHFLLVLVAWSYLGVVIYLITIAYIIPYGIAEAFFADWLERRTRLPRAVGFGILYVISEKVRSIGELSFPADLNSHAFGTHPAWLAWDPWLGPFGLTLVILVVAILFEEAWQRWVSTARGHRGRAYALGCAAVLLWLLPPITDRLMPAPAAPASTIEVGVVQPSVTLDDKLKRDRWPAMRAKLEDLTRRVAPGVDLVVWPESARAGPVLWHDGEPFRDAEMEALATEIGVPILYGCEIARIREKRILALYNGAALARPGGGEPQWYGKQHLLPLVEGIPFAKALGLDRESRGGSLTRSGYLSLAGNFSPGTETTLFRIGEARVGVMICYEGFYPDLARRYRRQGANVLAVLTNDAWWRRSVFARWHAGAVATRARELGVPIVRAANSGVSSVLDAEGRTHGATGLFETTTVRYAVNPGAAETTLYARVGDWPVGLCALVAAGAFLGRRIGRRRTSS